MDFQFLLEILRFDNFFYDEINPHFLGDLDSFFSESEGYFSEESNLDDDYDSIMGFLGNELFDDDSEDTYEESNFEYYENETSLSDEEEYQYSLTSDDNYSLRLRDLLFYVDCSESSDDNSSTCEHSSESIVSGTNNELNALNSILPTIDDEIPTICLGNEADINQIINYSENGDADDEYESEDCHDFF